MDGFVTLAVGQPWLDRAVAFALSARRFGYPVTLMHKQADLARCTDVFHKTVDIGGYPVLNHRPPCSIWELKRYAWTVTSEFQRCAYCDADSLIIRDPGPVFDLAEPVHTPGACDISDTMRWAIPPFVDSTVELGLELGIRQPIQTLNGGFFVWDRSASAQRWFDDWVALNAAIGRIYRARSRADVRDELCMAFAFAKQEIRLSRSDSSIGLWDARDLTLDIQEQQFECTKGFYWQGHRFNPYIAHFGGRTISHQYRDSVDYLLKDSGIDLPVFVESDADTLQASLRNRAKFNGYSVSQDECERLVEFVRSHGVQTVLEFGPGASTWYFAAAGCEVWSVESDRKWYERHRQEFADVPNVHVIHYDVDGELTIPETDDRQFDMAFVDAPPGHYYRKYARINSAIYAARHSDMWILHDTRREGEQNTVSVFEDLGWSVENIPARAGLAVFTRKRVGNRTPPSTSTVRQPPNSKTPSTPSEATCSRSYDFSHWNTLPKISCQCITYGRPHLLNEAVEAFLRQDYPGESELVILNDHAEITIRNPGIDNVTTINVPQRIRSVGEKRNACCGFCTGSVILPWDDDDISLPWRISLTVQNMTNLAYYKPDRLWYWSNGQMTIKRAVAHAMGGWSRSLFDEAEGYPHIESGQDQGLEDRFQASGQRDVRPLDARDVFYIYRFPGTGSYHLSAHGFGTGMDNAERFVRDNVRPGEYELAPEWLVDYTSLAAAAVETE